VNYVSRARARASKIVLASPSQSAAGQRRKALGDEPVIVHFHRKHRPTMWVDRAEPTSDLHVPRVQVVPVPASSVVALVKSDSVLAAEVLAEIDAYCHAVFRWDPVFVHHFTHHFVVTFSQTPLPTTT